MDRGHNIIFPFKSHKLKDKNSNRNLNHDCLDLRCSLIMYTTLHHTMLTL